MAEHQNQKTLDKLPADVLIHIFSFFKVKTLLSVSESCWRFYDIVTTTGELNSKCVMKIAYKQLEKQKNEAKKAVLNSNRVYTNVNFKYWHGEDNINKEEVSKEVKVVLEILKHIGKGIKKLSFGERYRSVRLPMIVLNNILKALPNLVELSISEANYFKANVRLEAPELNHLEELIVGTFEQQFSQLFAKVTSLKKVELKDGGDAAFFKILCLQKNLKELNVFSNDFGMFDEDINSAVAFSLTKFAYVQHEYFGDEIPASQITNLGKFLSSQSSIEYLNLCFGPERCELLAPIVQMKNLKEFHLQIIRSFELPPNMPQMKNLSVKKMIVQIDPNEEGYNLKAEHLIKIINCFQGLHTLEMTICGRLLLDPNEVLSLDFLEQLKDFTLILKRRYVREASPLFSAIRMKNLNKLVVEKINGCIVDWKNLVIGCSNITQIDLLDCGVDNATIEVIAVHCQKLEKITFNYGIMFYAANLFTCLNQMDKKVISILSSNCEHLKHVKLSLTGQEKDSLGLVWEFKQKFPNCELELEFKLKKPKIAMNTIVSDDEDDDYLDLICCELQCISMFD